MLLRRLIEWFCYLAKRARGLLPNTCCNVAKRESEREVSLGAQRRSDDVTTPIQWFTTTHRRGFLFAFGGVYIPVFLLEPFDDDMEYLDIYVLRLKHASFAFQNME